MRKITLPGTDLTTTRLGFGTAALMARLGRRESVRLLELAHESGIGHFDTARAYGYGEAESALGDFLSAPSGWHDHYHEAGYGPAAPVPRLRAAKAVARVAASRTPALRKRLRERAHSMVRSGRFAAPEARASLETSLSEMRIDCVDILLMHECSPEDLQDELLELLEALVREGKIRYFGIATDIGSTRTIMAERPQFARIVQVRNNALEPVLQQLPLDGRATITHAAMRVLVARLMDALNDPGLRHRWSDELGLDCSSREIVGKLLMAWSLHSNDGGVVLFSSTDEGRIRSNAALVEGHDLSADRIDTFAGLAREAISTPLEAQASA